VGAACCVARAGSGNDVAPFRNQEFKRLIYIRSEACHCQFLHAHSLDMSEVDSSLASAESRAEFVLLGRAPARLRAKFALADFADPHVLFDRALSRVTRSFGFSNLVLLFGRHRACDTLAEKLLVLLFDECVFLLFLPKIIP
jgi:hypothetical protein